MPSESKWFLENRVIVSRPSGIVTLEELSQSSTVITKLLREADAKGFKEVHLLVDTTQVQTQPSPLAARKVFTYMGEKNLGWTVIGGVGNPVIYFFTKFVSTLVQGRTRIFESPEQALSFLMRKDPSLPDLIHLFRRQSVKSQ